MHHSSGISRGSFHGSGTHLDREDRYIFPGEPEGFTRNPARRRCRVGAWPREPVRRVAAFRNELPCDPTFRQNGAYFEARRALNPPWYVAVPTGFLHEVAAGFRPNTWQFIKAGYMVERERASSDLDKVIGVQLVTMLHPLSMAWRQLKPAWRPKPAEASRALHPSQARHRFSPESPPETARSSGSSNRRRHSCIQRSPPVFLYSH